MIFFSGILAGFVMSIPPGPATAGLLEPSLKGRQSLAIRHLISFLVADLFILMVVAILWQSFGPFSKTLWLRFFGGIFLVVLALKALFAPKKDEAPSRSFWRTIFNPGAWFVAIGVISFSTSKSFEEFLWYLGGVQIGSILWFGGLIRVLSLVPVQKHQWVQRFSVLSLLLIGILVIFTSIV